MTGPDPVRRVRTLDTAQELIGTEGGIVRYPSGLSGPVSFGGSTTIVQSLTIPPRPARNSRRFMGLTRCRGCESQQGSPYMVGEHGR